MISHKFADKSWFLLLSAKKDFRFVTKETSDLKKEWLIWLCIGRKSLVHALIVSAILVASGNTQTLNNPSASDTQFSAKFSKSALIFDGTLYSDKPNMDTLGIQHITILYVSQFWPNWDKGISKDELPKKEIVLKLAREANKKGSLVAIDIEHWPLTGDDTEVKNSINKFSKVIRWFREEAIGIRLGLFGVMPIADYHRSRKPQESNDHKKWKKENERLRPLAELVDVVFPHTYTFFPKQAEWQQFAIQNVQEALRYGKPVYLFLWPQYSETNRELRHKYVSADFWKMQLETAHQNADGIVIWGGWGDGKPATWDEDASWWQVTKEFIRENRKLRMP